MDRTFRGLIAGLIAGIIMNIWNMTELLSVPYNQFTLIGLGCGINQWRKVLVCFSVNCRFNYSTHLGWVFRYYLCAPAYKNHF